MKGLLLPLLLTASLSSSAQLTQIPDNNFEQALIDLELDNQLDGFILTANIVSVTHLDIPDMSIQDLTGIEGFESLSYLNCSNNSITTIDVSNNPNLVFLFCPDNDLESLIMPESSPVFRELLVNNNNLTSLEMSNYANVAWIIADNNLFNSINLSGSTIEFAMSFINNELSEINLAGADITFLHLDSNQFSFLDLSLHPGLKWFSAAANPELNCIKVNQAQFDSIPSDPQTGLWEVDSITSYSLECVTHSSDISVEFLYKTFPNPSLGIFTINVPKQTNIQASVFDVLGKVVTTSNETSTFNLDLSDMPVGIYTLRLDTESGLWTKKLVRE
jgi:hypothetical protein